MHTTYRSKALAAAGCDAARRTLRLRFRNGGLYDYLDVPAEVFDGLITSAHPWTEWHEHIRSAYAYERIE